MSTPQPILQTPYYSEQTRVTVAPILSGSANVQTNVPKVDVVYTGEGNLLSQTINQKGPIRPSQQQSQQSAQSHKSITNAATNAEESNSSGRIVQRKGTQAASSQIDQKQANSFTANKISSEQTSVTNRGTSIGSVTQTTLSIPSTQSFGQRNEDRVIAQSKPQSTSSNTVQPLSSFDRATTYNNRVSFGQKVSTIPAAASTTTVPYSPSVPPFRSTVTTTYTPTATSFNQHTQTYNGQSQDPSSFTRHDNVQSAFSNNQFQVPSKEYLPSADNTRTARTNELSFGNHGSSTLKLSSSHNFARNTGNQQDGRQQFTYPVDQVIE